MTSCVITCLGARPLYAHTDRSGECSCCFQADIGEVARSVVVAPNAAVRSARPEAVAQVPIMITVDYWATSPRPPKPTRGRLHVDAAGPPLCPINNPERQPSDRLMATLMPSRHPTGRLLQSEKMSLQFGYDVRCRASPHPDAIGTEPSRRCTASRHHRAHRPTMVRRRGSRRAGGAGIAGVDQVA